MVKPTKKKHRLMIQMEEEDDQNLELIMEYYRIQTGFNIRIAEVQRRLWRAEVERIKKSGVSL